uniref:Predicted protein n=1 Tax=Hordeum vulgare subsp. vulgare TaxID=112509 RepID=F2CUT0_HORVV|nr:predicted protein [Hordeum vulgare subsp. vulgare]
MNGCYSRQAATKAGKQWTSGCYGGRFVLERRRTPASSPQGTKNLPSSSNS